MRQRERRKLRPTAVVVLLVLAGVVAGWAIGAAGDGWFGRFLRSRTTLAAGAAAMASLLALCLLAGAMWRLGRAGRSRRGEGRQAGTAAIEFALVFPFALMIVLIMIQSMLLMVGNLAVHYAAFAAARAAVVRVPENVSYDEPRNVVCHPLDSAKYHRIRCAAVYALMPVAAGKPGAGGTSTAGGAATIADGLGRFFELSGSNVPRWIETMLAAKVTYAWDYTDVELFGPDDGLVYGDHEDLRVRVRHTLYLPVPYANRIFGSELPAGAGDYGTTVEATYALTNCGVVDEIDQERFPRTVGRDEW